MEISRIDPYLARWSSDSVIALACELAGLQFLSLNAEILLNDGALKWNRIKAPADMPKGRVSDMHWSPTLTSKNAGCLLAAVLHTGVVVVLETGLTEVKLAYTIHGANYTAVNWLHQKLLLGDANGNISIFDGETRVSTKKMSPEINQAIKYIVSSESSSVKKWATVLADNSTWVWNQDSWNQINEPSRYNVVDAITLSQHNSDLVTLRCGRIYVEQREIPTSSQLPGFILTSKSMEGVVAVHANGVVSDVMPDAPTIALPQIKGNVLSAQLHPELPIGLIISGTGSASNLEGNSKMWRFPILSSQNASLHFFPVEHALMLPHRKEYDFTSAWLTFTVHSKKLSEQSFENVSPMEDALLDEIASQSLENQLEALFLSDLFDIFRFKWFLADLDEKETVVKSMRGVIAKVLNKFTPESPLDQLIITLYNHTVSQIKENEASSFTLGGDNIKDTFMIGTASSPTVMTSTNGRVWKRCALTLSPLLKLECYQSSDKSFVKCVEPPTDLNDTQYEDNPIASALLASSKFCVFNGVSWQ